MLKRLAGQTAIYGFSSIVARFLNYLLVPYLTRILSTEGYGVVSDLYSIVPFMLILLTMGMETGYFRFMGKAGTPEERRKVFSTTWGAVICASVFFLCAVLLFREGIASAMRYSDHVSYVVVMALVIMLDAVTAIPFARLRQENKAVRFVVLRVLSVLINIGFCIFFLSVLPRLAAETGFWGSIHDPLFGPGYVFVANLIASAVILLMLLPTSRDSLPRIDPALFKVIFLYSLPLLVSGVSGTANEFIDRQLLKYLLPADTSLKAVGIYSAVAKTAMLMALFTQMYRYAAEPFFLSGFKKKEDFANANAMAMKYFVIVSVCIFLFTVLFVDLLALFVGEDFREGMPVMPILLLANVFAGILFNLSFWYKYAELTRFAIYITLFGLLFTISLNLLLIPVMGFYGAAWARLACEAAMVALSYYLNQKYHPVPYDLKSIFGYLGLGAVIYFLAVLIPIDPLWAKYTFRMSLIAIFVLLAARREKINFRSFFERRNA